MVLNGQVTVVDGLDIFARVGRGVAHDEIIPFSVRDGQLQYGTETVGFTGKLLIEFVKVNDCFCWLNLNYVFILCVVASFMQSCL